MKALELIPLKRYFNVLIYTNSEKLSVWKATITDFR